MVCERCGTVFCWDDAPELTLGGLRKRYCSETCRKKSTPGRKATRSRSRARAKQRASCAKRGKKLYPDSTAAMKDVEGAFRKNGVQMYPYQCACGWWHLTSTAPERGEMAQALRRALFGDSASEG